MTKTDFSTEIFTAAALHLDVTDEFIAIAQAKLADAGTGFARDSLTDLLAGLTEQRDGYRAVLDAAPRTVTALAA